MKKHREIWVVLETRLRGTEEDLFDRATASANDAGFRTLLFPQDLVGANAPSDDAKQILRGGV